MQYKLQIRNLRKSFGKNHVLRDVNIDFANKRSSVILGSSGTGKSVLIKIIAGLMKQDSGSIMYGDHNIGNNNQVRAKYFSNYGFLFQNGALFDSMNIQENITFLAEKLMQEDLKTSKSKYEFAAEKLKMVGLSSKILKLYPAELSGGMQKRAALARAIAMNPEVIFFDEPTTGLDPIMANVINELIVKIREELDSTTITITHDMNSTKIIAQDVFLIHNGKIVWSGDVDSLEKSDNSYINQFVNGLTYGPIAM